MTKLRAPGSIEEAVLTVGKALGWEAAAALVDRKPRAVADWSDPDTSANPTLAAALALDAAYDAATGRGWPIADAFQRAVDRARAAASSSPPAGGCLLEHTAEIVREGGQAHAALVAANLPGASRAARLTAFAEVIDAKAALGAVLPQLMVGLMVHPP